MNSTSMVGYIMVNIAKLSMVMSCGAPRWGGVGETSRGTNMEKLS